MFTKKELAAHYKIGSNTVDRLMLKGLPYLKFEKSVRFDEDEVKQWLLANQGDKEIGKTKKKD